MHLLCYHALAGQMQRSLLFLASHEIRPRFEKQNILCKCNKAGIVFCTCGARGPRSQKLKKNRASWEMKCAGAKHGRTPTVWVPEVRVLVSKDTAWYSDPGNNFRHLYVNQSREILRNPAESRSVLPLWGAVNLQQDLSVLRLDWHVGGCFWAGTVQYSFQNRLPAKLLVQANRFAACLLLHLLSHSGPTIEITMLTDSWNMRC